jgi:hypothetical protein
LRFYEVKYPIEEKLYTMFLEHRMRTFQGAFHNTAQFIALIVWLLKAQQPGQPRQFVRANEFAEHYLCGKLSVCICEQCGELHGAKRRGRNADGARRRQNA